MAAAEYRLVGGLQGMPHHDMVNRASIGTGLLQRSPNGYSTQLLCCHVGEQSASLAIAPLAA
jgi:hypothetical protein